MDVNVGRLAKWLRAMGYDALFIPNVDDGDLVKTARREERIILTKDRRLRERRLVTTGELKVLLVQGDRPMEQLRYVADELGLKPSDGFLRCIECNSELHGVDKKRVVDRVPPFVFRTQELFKECLTCHKVYWRGTHWHNMKREMARVLDGADA